MRALSNSSFFLLDRYGQSSASEIDAGSLQPDDRAIIDSFSPRCRSTRKRRGQKQTSSRKRSTVSRGTLKPLIRKTGPDHTRSASNPLCDPPVGFRELFAYGVPNAVAGAAICRGLAGAGDRLSAQPGCPRRDPAADRQYAAAFFEVHCRVRGIAGCFSRSRPAQTHYLVSYAAELARKMSNDFRAALGSEWYQAAFPLTRIGRFKDSESEIELDSAAVSGLRPRSAH